MNQYATQFSVYQNPVLNTLQLVVQLPTKQKLTLQVRDMNGRVIIQQEQTGYTGRASLSVPVERLNKGTYLIQVKSESINTTKTFIKQ
ncbi:MAG: T9SS type A sorting domain-containing protein [Williamsia sp.]|nr:T9SS type A sorting domain-containing protein [Williamsia sp.]